MRLANRGRATKESSLTVATTVERAMLGASWIRRMFEAGRALKERIGDENVFDFSLGNPFLEPPEAFQQALRDLTHNPPPGMHRYMPNGGFPSTRAAVARKVSAEQGVEVEGDDVIMTVGAAGSIHVTLKAVLDPGDEVIILAPYFVEYLFYIETHQGVTRIVETDEHFNLDIAAIASAIGPRTKALIINTPNNPTGVIYGAESMRQLGELLAAKEQEYGRTIYLLVDTPYAKITYGGASNPPLFNAHPSTIINHSHSKDLGLAGERLGYLVISPRAPARQMLRGACTFCNRVLGFINAPALMQLALERAIDATVDMAPYIEAQRVLVTGLRAAGYEFVEPEGAFYVFPRAPGGDDLAFTEMLREQNVLVVPGRGFGRAGYVRVAYCVDPKTLERALPAFAKVKKRMGG
ncbi:MAG: pyridoxal phosphate-dependent aminotransferase [Myxococcales bacterium]|nr:pyridoxal phosphate-dependent aminotransferase [Myxococcales bacterium]